MGSGDVYKRQGLTHDGSDAFINIEEGSANPVNVTGASVQFDADGRDTIQFLDTTGGTLAESGRFAGAGMNWGRWENVAIGASTIVNGTQVDIRSEVPTGVHYVFIDDPRYALTSQAKLDDALSGSNLQGAGPIQITQVVGNTTPTNLLGNLSLIHI